MRLVGGGIIFLFALLIQLKFGRVGFGLENFLLLSLVALATVLRTRELLFFILLSIWFLNWQPSISGELVALVAIPFGVHVLKDIFPGSAFFGCVLAAGLGVGLWYVLAYARVILEFPFVFVGEIILGILWSFPFFVAVQFLRPAE
ncbi:MAG: hypothetical protein FJY98_03705 [Candidatus Liptonbacteria bacterium]|nr:hypothetical protein [Candidatus Liptonbacteria bacterium]